MLLNDLNVGQVVISKLGRDKGRLFFIIKVVNEEYVLIADGDYRKLDKAKLKKVKHLIKYKYASEDIENRILNKEYINDAFLRYELDRLKSKL
ncbi:KOW domain-containing RNA-binding protein [Tepidibacter mesophilus]|uniref:KOW domain-containing RNA-binding protein n=1 Tax=Tepidibacter mesophilus TaxID=655607 RepID=UPI000C06E8B3|nr:KOW domain-containing RNA-binding protein [Tepidibacter mesophilus]